MAIAFDASSNTASGTSPRTWSHTCTGSDRVLVVGTFGSTADPTSVTYGGVALTKYGTGISVGDAYHLSMWYLLNPASGANDIVVTAGANVGGIAMSYTGVLDAVDSYASGQSGATPIDGTTTVVDANCWLVMFVTDSGSNPAAGTGTTQRVSGTPGGAGGFDSNGTVSTGAQSLQATYTGGNNNSGFLIASLSPTGGAVGPTNLKSLDTNVKANIKSYNGNLLANIKSIAGNA